jgi:hypothetical protein
MKEYMLDSQTHEPLHDVLKNTIRTRHPKNVGELARLVKVGAVVDEDDFANELRALIREKTIELRHPSYQTKSILDYFSTISLSGWFWATMTLTVVAVLSIALIPDNFPINLIRWFLGSAFVLYLPGYALIQALFPREKDFSDLERLLLSVGASLAAAPLVGLVVNYLPWGLRLTPITIALAIFVIFFALVAATRKYRTLQAIKE